MLICIYINMWNINPINVISVIKNEIIGLVVRMDQQHNNGELITISSLVAADYNFHSYTHPQPVTWLIWIVLLILSITEINPLLLEATCKQINPHKSVCQLPIYIVLIKLKFFVSWVTLDILLANISSYILRQTNKAKNTIRIKK